MLKLINHTTTNNQKLWWPPTKQSDRTTIDICISRYQASVQRLLAGTVSYRMEYYIHTLYVCIYKDDSLAALKITINMDGLSSMKTKLFFFMKSKITYGKKCFSMEIKKRKSETKRNEKKSLHHKICKTEHQHNQLAGLCKLATTLKKMRNKKKTRKKWEKVCWNKNEKKCNFLYLNK